MIKQEDVTIIIPHLGATKEQKTSLIECMISLEDTFKGPIIIASNGKQIFEIDTETYGGLIGNRGQYKNIHVVEQGQCKAVNAAAATVTTPWILITNDDMIFPPNWFEDLVGPLEQNFLVNSQEFKTEDFIPGAWIPVDDVSAIIKIKEIMCISPKLVEPRAGAPTFEVYFCGGAGGDFDKKKFIEYVNTRKVEKTVALRNGFNLPFLIKKELWDTIGGYDINYDPWGSNSDSDLLYKIRLAGVQPQQAQNSRVYHFSQTSGTFLPENSDYWGKNFQYFIDKWGFTRTDNRIWEADFKMPTVEEGRIFKPNWEGKYS